MTSLLFSIYNNSCFHMYTFYFEIPIHFLFYMYRFSFPYSYRTKPIAITLHITNYIQTLYMCRFKRYTHVLVHFSALCYLFTLIFSIQVFSFSQQLNTNEKQNICNNEFYRFFEHIHW